MIKLSKSQIDVLSQAAHYERSIWRKRRLESDWWIAQHHECAEIIARWQTCASLCGLGLLRYRTIDYIRRHGQWTPENEYRVTEAGLVYFDNYIKPLEQNSK